MKKGFDDQIKDIRENYAHKDNVSQAMGQIKDIVNDVKTEQHRMASRMDELFKFLITKDDKK